MADWIYIDEIDHFPNIPVAHCDTRDFHILLVSNEDYLKISEEDRIDPIRKCRSYPIEKYLFNQQEILGWLKSLEYGSGGKHNWRHLAFDNTPFKGWVKYIRFYRTEYEGEPCYFAYTTEGNRYIPLSRTDYIQENIIEDTYTHDLRRTNSASCC